jgi:hypothetical protein
MPCQGPSTPSCRGRLSPRRSWLRLPRSPRTGAMRRRRCPRESLRRRSSVGDASSVWVGRPECRNRPRRQAWRALALEWSKSRPVRPAREEAKPPPIAPRTSLPGLLGAAAPWRSSYRPLAAPGVSPCEPFYTFEDRRISARRTLRRSRSPLRWFSRRAAARCRRPVAVRRLGAPRPARTPSSAHSAWEVTGAS